MVAIVTATIWKGCHEKDKLDLFSVVARLELETMGGSYKQPWSNKSQLVYTKQWLDHKLCVINLIFIDEKC